MSVITVFNALYCNEEAIIRGLVTESRDSKDQQSAA